MSQRPIRIALYNHKGGVGKTTLTINIASALCKLGKRVLLVDSDPQCNLSSFFIENKYLDKLLDTSDLPSGKTIWSALKPIVEAEGDVKVISAHSTRTEGLSIVPGDIRLAEFESCLGDFWSDCLQRRTRGYRGTNSLSALTGNIARKVSADFVFYDTGPNIGALNRIILLDVDFFIVPVACDLFSLRALKSLGQSLYNWITAWKTISEFAPDNAKLFDGRPKFLGYIPQQFRTYGGEIASSALPFLAQLEKGIFSDIVRVLHSIDETLAPSSLRGTKLGDVKAWGTLIQKAQEQHRPLSDVEGAVPYQRQEANSAFTKIARAVLKGTEALP